MATDDGTGAGRGAAPLRQRRAAARLRAVQALYQRAMTGAAVEALLAEFHAHRLEAGAHDEEEAALPPPESSFFDDLVAGVAAREAELDRLIAGYLAEGWTLARLDPLLLQLLRAGTYELVARPDVPLAAVIAAYVDVAHAFFPREQTGFVNALLDRVGHAVRGGSARGAV
ncbi:MAG: transcription antitermination factor NusB [Thermaurantiacus tibetensis]